MRHRRSLQPCVSRADRLMGGLAKSCLLLLFVCCSTKTKAAGDGRSLDWRYSYDKEGRLAAITDPANKRTLFTYDADTAGRLSGLKIEYPGTAAVRYQFNTNGLLERMTDARGATVYEYDAWGRPVKVADPSATDLRYRYDADGRLLAKNVGSGWNEAYTHDFLGRISKVGTPAGEISYEFDSNRATVFRTLPGGVQTVRKYRPDGLLESITHVDAGHKLIAEYTYSYRPDALIGSVKELTQKEERTIRYQYDKAHRLTGVADSRTGTTTYRYDETGNRTEAVLPDGTTIRNTYDWAGRMTLHNGSKCTHDASGNLTTLESHGRSLSLEYNGMSRVAALHAGKENLTYSYDGAGRLVGRTHAGVRTEYVCDPFAQTWRPLSAKRKSSAAKHFLYEGDLPAGVSDANGVRFYLHDDHGSARIVVDPQGNILEQRDYDPFGTPLQQFSGEDLEPGFAGLFFDPGAGVYLTRARVYHPRLGRFLQIDPKERVPAGAQRDLSMYAYCGGDPVNWVDVDGAAPERRDYLYYLGARQGEESARYWANRYVETGNFGYAIAGTAASLWTPDTYWKTAGVIVAAEAASVVGTKIAESLVVRGIQYGSRNEIFHLPFLPDAIRAQLLNPHIGVGLYGLHAAIGALHAYAEGPVLRLWAPQMGSVALSFTDAVFATIALPDALRQWSDAIGSRFSNTSREQNANARGEGVIGTDYRRNQQYGPPPPPPPPPPPLALRSHSGKDFDDNNNHNDPPPPGGGGRTDHRRDFPPPPPPGGGGGGSPLSPSPVGGVYLRGAGDALKGLGNLSGVALDEKNGRLILLGKGGETVNLPPLRLDDLVTIFRSVYQHGDAPYVSIDPDPANPLGPVMNIRHGKGTEGTRVGWVLFETDRIMKGYSLGVDNVSRDKIRTSVPGYTNIFGGGGPADKGNANGETWERFWIVPAQVSRLVSKNGDLTLLDVPLMVKTEPMVMKNGVLESAPGRQPSPQAKSFAEWFTKSYDSIAEEALSPVPQDKETVKPFHELRRIALISAIAERLRDQGVSMPGWMKEYRVSPCSFGTTTPALTVEETLKRIIKRVYGGVSLAPPDEIVMTKLAAPEATGLASAVRQMLKADPLSLRMNIENKGETLAAFAIPGDATRDIGSLRLGATDLRVPVQRGTQIAFTRNYNSFFQPSDAFGSSWTLDLPVLEKLEKPVKRTQGKTTYAQVYHLTSPLNGRSAVFEKEAFVAAANTRLLAPAVEGEFLGMSSAEDKRIGERTDVVLLRDGSFWHFSADKGLLTAVEQKPLTLIYRRDNRYGLIVRIEGWYGKDLRADIRLDYDKRGRIVKAEGSNGDKVEYAYESDGGVAQVKSHGSVVSYRYAGPLVTDIALDGKPQHHFEYDARARLSKETTESGTALAYDARYEENGVTAHTTPGAKGASATTVRYDDSFRPVHQTLSDGTRADWRYGQGRAYEMTVTGAGGESYTQSRSQDGRTLQLRSSDGRAVEEQFDEAGRLTSLRTGGEILYSQEWLPDGQLASATTASSTAQPVYDENGVLKKLILAAAGEGDKTTHWMNTEYNEAGLVSLITDYSGSKIEIGYDKTLQPRIMVSKQGGIELARDDEGRVISAKTSWGEEQNIAYDGQGRLSRTSVKRGVEKQEVNFNQGLPVRITDFDGAETNVSYDKGSNGPRLKQVKMQPGLELAYGYDGQDRLTSVDCGKSYRITYSYDAGGRLTGVRRVGMR